MGLIKEPKNVDFYVLDKTWTNKEKNEFSKFIKLRKEQQKKRSSQKTSTKLKKSQLLIK
jgi:hypothetical protein